MPRKVRQVYTNFSAGEINNLLNARTDARAVEGFDSAVDRAKAYVAVNPFRESYSIGTVRKAHTEPRFSAAELYMWLAERFGGSLYSDKAQTTGGKSIWAKLNNKEKVPTEEDGEGKWRWRLTL